MRREKLKEEHDLYCMHCKLVSFPCRLSHCLFLVALSFHILEAVKTGQWEGLGMMLL